MNSAEYVDQQIQILKTSGIQMSDAAWEAALLCVGWPYIFGAKGQECTIAYRKQVSGRGSEQKYQNVKKACQAIRDTNPTGSCAGCKWYPGGKRVRSFDCRGFTYWILLQIYGWKLQGGGATSQWNNDDNWTAKGTIDSIPEDQLVCLFYPDKTNPKKMAHTGLGFRGETVECSNGVQHFNSRNKKWTHWALPKCVSGDIPEPVPPEPEKKPTLRKGSTGPYVTLLQTELINRGYSCGKSGMDGKFGNDTFEAVKAFQKDYGLTVDGIVGPKTWDALDNAEPTVYYTVTVPHLTQTAANQLLTNYPGSSITKEY